MATPKKFSTTQTVGKALKATSKVVRYDSPKGDDDEVISNSYPKKEMIEKLGNPDKIKITIEAA